MRYKDTTKEDIEICVDFYRDLERRFMERGLDCRYLESTAGVELFNTDRAGLTPDVSYVLSSLAKAEDILVRHANH